MFKLRAYFWRHLLPVNNWGLVTANGSLTQAFSLTFSAVFSKKIMLKMKGSTSSSKCCIVIFLITVNAYTIVTSLDNGLALTPPSKRNIYSRFNFNLPPFLVTWDACFERSWFTIFSGYRRFAYLTQHFLFKCRWNFSLEY